ncbi:MAG: armadillo-type protein [Monoraphidium minutum]|nr:MAG: armadillo-type protein [Monoraphidium minutum]
MQQQQAVAQQQACEPNQVLQLLLGALSHDQAVQKQAELGLQVLEWQPGYVSCLAAIIANGEADHSARWMASVQLKNAINKQWRPRYDNRGVTAEEKAYMRQHVLDLISQDDSKIAVQVALVVAKIARSDYPKDWPSLVSEVLGRAHGGSTLTVRRVYFVLHHVLKELSSKRLAVDQRNFAEARPRGITSQLLDHVWGQWCADLSTIMAGLPAALAAPAGAAAQPLLLHFERWLLLLKILRRLLVFGFPSDAKSLEPVAAVSTCAPALLQAAAALAAARPEVAPPGRVVVMVDRGVLKLVKTLAHVQEAHPWSFHAAGALLPTLDFCCARATAAAAAAAAVAAASGAAPAGGGSGGAAARSDLLVACMRYAVGVLGCDAYRGRAGALSGRDAAQNAGRAKAMAAEAQAALDAFWAAPAAAAAAGGGAEGGGGGGPLRRLALLRALMEGLFPLGPRDLDEWDDEPEAWHHAAEGGAWEDSPRPCAERLFVTLLADQRDALAPEVVSFLHAASAACPPAAAAAPDSIPGPRARGVPVALLRKEAAYAAAAVGAYELHDFLDYGDWLRGALLKELEITAPAARPLRRAAARAVGEWAPRLAPPDRPAAYAGLLSALRDRDAAVRLAAAGALRSLVDDFGFDAGQFVGVAPGVLEALAAMLVESAELDTQTQARGARRAARRGQHVFSLLNLIIERLGPDVRPFCDGILQLLPRVWQAAEGQSLLRIQVLAALQLLVNVLGPDSPAAYPLLLPLLQHSLDTGSSRRAARGAACVCGLCLYALRMPVEPELLEDGLLLWLVALRNAPAPQPPLLQPFPLLLQAMAASTEHVRAGLQIISSLVLLGGPPFLREHGAGLAALLAGYVGAVNERGTLLLLPPLDLLLVLFPADAPALLGPALGRLLGLLLGGREPPHVAANALGVAGRLLLQHPAAFQQILLSATADAGGGGGGGGGDAERAVGALTDVWVERFDSIGPPLARKLSALALCALLPLPSKAQLAFLPQIVGHVAAVWHAIEASGDDGEGGTLYCGAVFDAPRGDDGGWGGESLAMSEEAAGEAQRRAMVSEAEPLRRLRLSSFLRDQLAAAAAVHGPDLQAAMGTLGEGLGAQLQAVLAAAV